MVMNVEQLRSEFPELGEKVYGKQLVYLDNAATSQRPLSVVRKWEDLSLKLNSNLHRAVHHIAALATEEYERTRDYVKEYLNASCREEIIFTAGATASLNLVAYSFGEAFVNEGDEIIVTEAEHHSDIVPWQLLCERNKAVLKYLHVDESGHLDTAELEALVSEKTKLVCVAHISNVLGLVNPVREIAGICHEKGCRLLVDGAQGIVHEAVDVQDLDCDFYVFSGHKVYSAPGVGVLYGRKEILDKMPPFMSGGEMIANVKWNGTTFAPLPQKFEAGTQNMAGVPTLIPALELAKTLRDNEIDSQYNALRTYVYRELMHMPDVRLYGVPKTLDEKIALFSFTVKAAHHEDLALILDKMGIAVRSGQMCAEPLMDRYGVTGMLRASFAPYNTLAEAEYFISSLRKAIDMLK